MKTLTVCFSMELDAHTTPEKLEYYSFLWSEARLVVAAVALFLGGIPPVLFFNPVAALTIYLNQFLMLAWIISGLTALYLFYRWYTGERTVFGGRDRKDLVAFGVMIVTGLNLGVAGFTSTNIGMEFAHSYTLFLVAGVGYLITAGYLFRRWKEYGKKMF